MKALPYVVVLALAVSARAEGPVALTVHTDQTTKTIDKRIYGQFLEHIFNSVHGGLWGDQILNGTFEPRSGAQSVSALYWKMTGPEGEATLDRNGPFNATASLHLARTAAEGAAGAMQQKIALAKGEKYTLTLYARGKGTLSIYFTQDAAVVAPINLPIDKPDWTRMTAQFTATQSLDAADLAINLNGAGDVHIDQVSLFSASALATGGYRPDLLQAVSDLQPATIRWPGGSFANNYLWQNAVGPRDKRIPHPVEQWNDRDPYQFGTDEFLQLCEKIGSEPILVLNTARGVEDALHWLEYCTGDAATEFGKQRAANGHPAPYKLNVIEIDNEPWLLMEYPKYLDIVQKLCPAIRAQYPNLKLSVAGSYAYDTGPGEGSGTRGVANTNWDPHIIGDAAKNFDILSPHYYNGLLAQHPADYVEDPRKYEAFLKGRGELIKKSANPDIKIYVSEWNLTKGPNDWRMGLYAGGILNGFERQADVVALSCPALFMRKIGVTNSWDNALINFDQKSWFPAANYVVMKLWREAYAPNLLAVEGPDHPLNFVATRSEDKKTVFLKIVNPEKTESQAAITLDGDFAPKTAAMELIAPGAEDIKNTLATPDKIKPVSAATALDGRTVKFTMPPLSAATVRMTQ